MKIFGMHFKDWWFYLVTARYLITADRIQHTYAQIGRISERQPLREVIERAYIKSGSVPDRIAVTTNPTEAMCFGYWSGRRFLKGIRSNFPNAKRDYGLVTTGDAWFTHHVQGIGLN